MISKDHGRVTQYIFDMPDGRQVLVWIYADGEPEIAERRGGSAVTQMFREALQLIADLPVSKRSPQRIAHDALAAARNLPETWGLPITGRKA